MFTTALFIIAKTLKQPKCPSTDEWIKKMWYTHNGILLGNKKEEILPFVTKQMDFEGVMLGEIS